MSDSFDVYTDAFTVTVTPFGVNLSFGIKEPHPVPTSIQQPVNLGVVRMSNEHLKTMVFILWKQMIAYEEGSQVHCDVPTQVLGQLGLAREDWDAFWRPRGG